MSGYGAVARASFRVLLRYRAAAAAGIGTRIFWGLIRMMIFEGFYRSSTHAQPMSYADVVTYVWLGQGMLALILWRVDGDVQAMIRGGTVAYELLRPLDLYGLWYSRAVAARTAPTLVQAVPVLLIAALFFGLQAPASPAAALGWMAATLCAVLLSCAFSTLITVSLLWTLSGEGMSRLMPALTYMLSGMLVPIPLFPGWAQAILELLPFRGLIDVPFRVYLGYIPPGQVWGVLAQQLGWTVFLVVLGRWLLARAMRRLVVQGG